MESKQTAQMVAWLDEERRKDKSLIVKLEERTAAQAALVEDQTRRVQALEGELAALRTSALTVNLFDESITRFRGEISTAIDQFQRKSAEQEAKRIQDIVGEFSNKAIESLRDELLTRIERELQPRRAEEERLSRIAVELQNYADNLGKNLEEFQRTLSFLEEQRRQDSRRLSDIGSIQTETGKKMESQQTKLELLEELSRRNERALGELSSSFLEMNKQYQTTQEQEALAQKQREKLIGDTLKRIEANMNTFNKQVENWTETYRTMKKHVGDFERLADRVDRRLNEVSEGQRLSEERFRREWEEFQQEDQKLFRQFTLTNDESWRENNKVVGALSERVSKLIDTSDQISDQLKSMNTSQKDAVEALMGILQTLHERAEVRVKPAT